MRLVIDTDPGNGIPGADIDDGLAIGLALRSPEVTLEAVTVVAGNVPLERGVECASEILEAGGAIDVPVHRGASRPLVHESVAWRLRLDVRRYDERALELWQDVAITPASKPVDPKPAAQALVDIVNDNPGEITVLCIAPLTNIAAAMILDSDWAAKVHRLVIMAGAFAMPTVLQELNAAYDPEATHRVLTSAAPMLIVPLDVTTRTFMRFADLDRLESANTPLSSYLARTVRPWVRWQIERYGRDGCSLHDALALAALLDPEVITTRSASVDIELHGTLTRGRTVAWEPHNEELLHADLTLPRVRPITLAVDVDNARFMPLLLDRLTA